MHNEAKNAQLEETLKLLREKLRYRVYFVIAIGGEPKGRILMEVWCYK